MNTGPKETVQWFVLGLLSHVVLLLLLFMSVLSVPDSWRGRILVQGYREGQPFGARSIRDHDALLWGLMALASIVVSLLVVWVSWNRRRWFAVGFLVPALWGLSQLLKPS
jgi:hypothetical protein